jgi:hypothetical protein
MAIVAFALATALVVAPAIGAWAYFISPYFTSDSGNYYFPNPGCFTSGFDEGTYVTVHELSGTCSHEIGARAENASGSTGPIVWDAIWTPAFPPSGAMWRYKIYHESSSGS